ncbi:hypothetical protein CALVIDRAFT_541826 [Calocera viscosa TUFC12733]|uniref:Zn(2)-C6 fungal-type domain-containing protein n=1 Tax=Calocera viscosa (strain TUFC12733) TaxID=1330018 RepID=A0A167HAT0_CALVF|nr:hypothetical protein CALVIDRAFT_541826 [Calocera viscosa TUFC12733]
MVVDADTENIVQGLLELRNATERMPDEARSAPAAQRPPLKRGSRACRECRDAKTGCIGWANPPCKRCRVKELDCVFVKCRRGGRARVRPKSPVETAPRKTSIPAISGELTSPKLSEIDVLMDDSTPRPSPDHLRKERLASLLLDGTVMQHVNHSAVIRADEHERTFRSNSSDLHLQQGSNTSVQDSQLTNLQNSQLATFLTCTMPQSNFDDTQTLPGLHGDATQSRSMPVDLFTHSQSHQRNLDMVPLPPSGLVPSMVHGTALPVSDQNPSYELNQQGRQLDGEGKEGYYGVAELAPQSVIQEEGLRRRASGALDEPSPQPSTGSPVTAVGIAHEEYFHPGPIADLDARKNQMVNKFAPEILDFVSPEMVANLFEYYFNNLHPHFPVLCPSFHTVQKVSGRSPFLLTTVCAVASRYSMPNTDISERIGKIAKALCFAVASRGSKTVEIVQASLLLCVWSVAPAQRHQEDLTWIIQGILRSTAQDLGIDRKRFPKADVSDSETQNQIRTWIHCYNRDQELSTQLGRFSTLRENASIRSPVLYLPVSSNLDDILTCTLSELYRFLSRTLALFRPDREDFGYGTQCDYMLAFTQFEMQLLTWKENYLQRQADNYKISPGAAATRRIQRFHRIRVNFNYHYSLLIVGSFGLKDALDHRPLDVGFFFNRCYSAATSVLRLAKHDYMADGWLRHAPDSVFVSISYAAISLLRFCRPRLTKLHTYKDTISDLLSDTADALESSSVSPSHIPSQYAHFLRSLIRAQVDGMYTPARSPGLRYAGLMPSKAPPPMPEGEGGPNFAVPNLSSPQDQYLQPDLFPPNMLTSTFFAGLESPGTLWDSVLLPGFEAFDGLEA